MPEEFELSNQPTELTDVPKQFTLSRGGEKIVVKNAEEATRALYEGFNTKTFDQEMALARDYGINMSKIRREIDVKKLEARFAENENRALIYCERGLDDWFEDVNNYWYNHRNSQEKGYKKMELAMTGLEKQMMDSIREGMELIFHQDNKDLRAASIVIERFNNSEATENNRLDLENFRNQIVFEMEYKASGNAYWQDRKIPERLQPRDISVRDTHPLLGPFREILEKLKSDGATELPSWLKEQGEMAGTSAVYQDMPLRLKKWLEEAKKAGADLKKLPFNYLENLIILDKKIHRRGEKKQ